MIQNSLTCFKKQFQIPQVPMCNPLKEVGSTTRPLSCNCYTKIINTGLTWLEMDVTALGGAGVHVVVLQQQQTGCSAHPSWWLTQPSSRLGIIAGSTTGSTTCRVSHQLQVDLAAVTPDPCLLPYSFSWGSTDSFTSQILSVLHFPGLLSSSVIQSCAWSHKFCPWISFPWPQDLSQTWPPWWVSERQS